MLKSMVEAMVAVACCVGVAAAAPPTAVTGTFSGKTSQHGRYRVRFRAEGTRITNVHITWRAPCRRNLLFRSGTHINGRGILMRDGAWSVGARYADPITGGYTGKSRMQFKGHFVSARDARGTFRIVVRVFRHGHRVTRCDTGLVHWTAHVKR